MARLSAIQVCFFLVGFASTVRSNVFLERNVADNEVIADENQISADDIQLSIAENMNMDDDVLKKGCGNNPADIVFVLDESGSIWGPDFERQLQFVEAVTKVFDIRKNGTHLGLMTFSTNAKIYFNLGQLTTEKAVIRRLGQVKQKRGGTRTYNAISKARTTMYSDKNIRPGVPHICILITDGESDNTARTAREAAKLRRQGVTVFAIGVGKYINRDELLAIASQPSEKYTFVVNEYKALMKLRQLLAVRACQVTPLPPPTPKPTTTTTTTTTTTPVPTRPQMMEGCRDRYPMDIIFSLPDQAGARDTDHALLFISDVIGETKISPVQVQAGLTPRYCENAPGIRLRDHDTRKGFLLGLETRRLIGTGTSKHLKYMYEDGISTQHGGRDDAAKFGILVVDNQSENLRDTLEQAQLAKFEMQLIVIGVGGNVDSEELKAIASDENSYFQVDDYDELDDYVELLTDRLCDGIRKHIQGLTY